MVKKLTKTGNSLALVLDKAMLERIRVDAETPLEVSTDGQVIVVSPVRDKKRSARIKALVDEADAEYAGVFRKLAE
jgi:antitoxin component of MazEF toxin-antitoxin module